MRRAVAMVLVVCCVLGISPSTAVSSGAGDAGAVIPVGDAEPVAGAVAANAVAMAASPSGRGLTVATSTGEVSTYGDAVNHGSVSAAINAPVLEVEATPMGGGYWLFGRDGGVFTFGDASFFGSTGAMRLNAPIVTAVATPTGRGYWLFARDGGVFTFGDAAFFGSTGDTSLNQPVIAASATPTGRGYWLVALDGGVFTFGDARFFGSAGGVVLNEPIVDVATTSAGGGYWLLARDGGIFTFGDAAFRGSATDRVSPSDAAVAIERGHGDTGYWVLSTPAAARVALAGDVHGERHIGDQVRRGANPLEHVAGLLRAADASAVNLETPAGTAGAPQHKQYVFLAPPELLGALVNAGVDVITLANNHALDHGAATMLDTVNRAKAAGLAVVGAGRNAADAYRPAYVDAPAGRRIAFVGLSRVVPPGWAATATRPGVASAYDERASLAAVRDARANADVVVVLIHWGVETSRCPTADLPRFVERLHAAGATIVAGHHPHVLQGVDARADRTTAYSLGNFVWYHNSPPSDLTGVLDVTSARDGSLDTRFHPAAIGDDGRPRLLDGEAAENVRRSVMTGSGGCWRP